MSNVTKYFNNKNFNTTLINFIFQYENKLDEIISHTILSKLLSYTNGIYKEEDSFAKAKLSNYIMNYSCKAQSINNVYFMNFSMLIPSDGVVKDNYLENAIIFLLDCIYKPNIENGIYNEKLFEREKRLYMESLLNGYKNINFIAEKNMLDLLDNKGLFNKLKYKDIENINRLTNEDIVNYYNKYIGCVIPKIFINGNINIEVVEKTINDYFNKLKLKKQKLLTNYNVFYNSNELIEKTEESKFYQSIVYMVYSIKDYTENDFYKFYLINLLLNSSSSDLLLYNLRKKNNLVYSCGSSVLLKNNILLIKTITSKKNIKLVKLVIEDIIKSLKEIDNYKENISNIVYRLYLNLEREKDDFYISSSNIINDYYKSDLSSEEEFEIINNIEKDELIDVINRIELKCIYTMEGTRE